SDQVVSGRFEAAVFARLCSAIRRSRFDAWYLVALDRNKKSALGQSLSHSQLIAIRSNDWAEPADERNCERRSVRNSILGKDTLRSRRCANEHANRRIDVSYRNVRKRARTSLC